MSHLALSCAALLQKKASVVELVALLPEASKAAVQAQLEQLRGLPENEIRQLWLDARAKEIGESLASASRIENTDAENASPVVREWLAARFTDS